MTRFMNKLKTIVNKVTSHSLFDKFFAYAVSNSGDNEFIDCWNDDNVQAHGKDVVTFRNACETLFIICSRKHKNVQVLLDVFNDALLLEFPDQANNIIIIKKQPSRTSNANNDANKVIMNINQRNIFKSIVKKLQKDVNAQYFLYPVDRTAYPDYYVSIKHPMDFETLTQELATVDDFNVACHMVRLIWNNCKQYNDEKSDIVGMASALEEAFEDSIATKLGDLLAIVSDSSGSNKKGGKVDTADSHQAAATVSSSMQEKKMTKEMIKHILSEMKKNDYIEPFLYPVDASEVSDYFDIIDSPMDISSIEKHHKEGKYVNKPMSIFINDMSLIWQNCSLYNGDGAEMTLWSLKVKEAFEKVLAAELGDDYNGTIFDNTSQSLPIVQTAKQSAPIQQQQPIRGQSNPALKKQMHAKMKSLVEQLMQMVLAEPFAYPVDLNIVPGYREIIATPMDLSTVLSRVSRYETVDDFLHDMRLIFSNCRTYNDESSDIFNAANELEAVFETSQTREFATVGKKRVADNPVVDNAPTITPAAVHTDTTVPTTASTSAPTTTTANANKRRPTAVASTLSKADNEVQYSELTADNYKDMNINQLKELLEIMETGGHRTCQKLTDGRINNPLIDVRRKCVRLSKIEATKYPTPYTYGGCIMVANYGEMPSQSKEPSRYFVTDDTIYPKNYSCKTYLRLIETSTDTSSNSVYAYIDVEVNSMINEVQHGFTVKPEFVIIIDGIRMAASDTPVGAWMKLISNTSPCRIIEALGCKLKRCRAVFNRVCISDQIMPFLEQIPTTGKLGSDYYKKIKSPMWMREIHKRLVDGVYDSEFDFAWDMRLVFNNCMSYNLPDSQLYKDANTLMCLFQELLCLWVLNVSGMSATSISSGEWDDWSTLRYFDAANPDDNFCCETNESLDASELVDCPSCEDQYRRSSIEDPNTWMCRRCVTVSQYDFDQSINKACGDIVVNDRSIRVFVPMNNNHNGWCMCKKIGTSPIFTTATASTCYLSPLGYEVSSITDISTQDAIEAETNDRLMLERATEFLSSKKPRAVSPIKRSGTLRSNNKQHMHDDDALELSRGKLCTYQIDADHTLNFCIDQSYAAILTEAMKDGVYVIKSNKYTAITSRNLPPTGLFGLHLTDVKAVLEALPDVDQSMHYNFTKQEELYTAVLQRVRDAYEVKFKFHAHDNIANDAITSTRWHWDLKRISATILHSPDLSQHDTTVTDTTGTSTVTDTVAAAAVTDTSDVMDVVVDTSDDIVASTSSTAGHPPIVSKAVESEFVPLLPADVTTSEGETLLAVWDFLQFLAPNTGHISFTFAEVVKCITKPPDCGVATLNQIIFDEICQHFTYVLLHDVKFSCAQVDENKLHEYLSSKPLNIVTWPAIASSNIHAHARVENRTSNLLGTIPNTCTFADFLTAAALPRTTDEAVQKDIICLLLTHPCIHVLMDTVLGQSSMHDIRSKCYDIVAVDTSVDDSDDCSDLISYQSMDEFLSDIVAFLCILDDDASISQADVDSVTELKLWLKQFLANEGIQSTIAICDSTTSSGSGSDDSTCSEISDNLKQKLLTNLVQVTQYINPLDFGNVKYLKHGDDALKAMRLVALTKLETALRLFRTCDPDIWSKAERIDVLTALIDRCANSTTCARLLKRRSNFASPMRRYDLPSDIPSTYVRTGVDTLVVVDDIDPSRQCYYSGKNQDASTAMVYVPIEYLSDSEKGSTHVAVESYMHRIMLAREYADRDRYTYLKKLDAMISEIRDDDYSNQVFDRRHLERSMPIGYDRYGSAYWLLEAQEHLTLKSLGSKVQTKTKDPSVLVKDASGIWYRHNSRQYSIMSLLEHFDDSIECERVLKELMIERYYFARRRMFKIFYNLRSLQHDWLKKVEALEANLASWTYPQGLSMDETIKRLEMHWSACVEVRMAVHNFLLYDEPEVKEKESKEDILNKSERSIKEAGMRRIKKVKGAWSEDHLDFHPSSGYLRSDHISRIRMLSTATTATRIHGDNTLLPQICSVVGNSHFRLYMDTLYGHDRSYLDKQLDDFGTVVDPVKAYYATAPVVVAPTAVKVNTPAALVTHATTTVASPAADTTTTTTTTVASTANTTTFFDFPAPPTSSISSLTAPAASSSDNVTDVYVNAPQLRASGQSSPIASGYTVTATSVGRENEMQTRRGLKPVEQLHLHTGEVLRIYPSGTIAAQTLGISQGGISLNCCGKQDEFHGFRWRFYQGKPIYDWDAANKGRKTVDEIKSLFTRSSRATYNQIKAAAAHSDRLSGAASSSSSSSSSSSVVPAARVAAPAPIVSQNQPAMYTTGVMTRASMDSRPIVYTQPAPNLILATEINSPRLLRLKAELISIIYIIPERKLKFPDEAVDATQVNAATTDTVKVEGKDDMQVVVATASVSADFFDGLNEEERSKRTKVQRKEKRRKRRKDELDKIVLGIRNATMPQDVMDILLQFEAILPYDLYGHCKSAPVIGNTCSALATRIFSLDRVLNYDSQNDFFDKKSNPSTEGTKKSYRPRIQHIPKCIFNPLCINNLGHKNSCQSGPILVSRVPEISDQVVQISLQHSYMSQARNALGHFGPSLNPKPLKRPRDGMSDRIGDDDDDDNEKDFDTKDKKKKKSKIETDIENMFPRPPPRNITEIVIV